MEHIKTTYRLHFEKKTTNAQLMHGFLFLFYAKHVMAVLDKQLHGALIRSFPTSCKIEHALCRTSNMCNMSAHSTFAEVCISLSRFCTVKLLYVQIDRRVKTDSFIYRHRIQRSVASGCPHGVLFRFVEHCVMVIFVPRPICIRKVKKKKQSLK